MNHEKPGSKLSEDVFEYRSVEKRKLIISLIITSSVMVLEFIGGFFTNSIALISDGGHMFTHCFAISIGLIAILIARKPPCHHRTFGLYRVEILAAFINGIFLLIVAVVIITESIKRIIHPREVVALQMLFVACIGLIVNITSIVILHGSHKKDLNIRGVFYHMVADTASSIGIILAAIIIQYTGWNVIDPVVGFLISAVIIYWAWGILKESGMIFLEMAPTGLTVDMIEDKIRTNFPEVEKVSHIHLWTITPDKAVLTAHIKLHDSDMSLNDQTKLFDRINNHLFQEYKIIETTLQITKDNEDAACNLQHFSS
jgi:cobalt-zinc-cadmium efflux system protein